MEHLLSAWPGVAKQLNGAKRILFLTDYDGTLTPIVGRPELADLPDDVRRLMRRLARKRRFRLGVISGRTLGDLKDSGCTVVTVGQYMQPSKKHHPVKRYYAPEEFQELKRHAEGLGLVAVAGPRVRSSYLAGEAYEDANLRRQQCA